MFIVITSIILIAGCSNESGDSESSADQANRMTEENAVEKSTTFTTANDSSGGKDGAATDQNDGSASEDNAASQADDATDADRKVFIMPICISK